MYTYRRALRARQLLGGYATLRIPRSDSAWVLQKMANSYSHSGPNMVAMHRVFTPICTGTEICFINLSGHRSDLRTPQSYGRTLRMRFLPHHLCPPFTKRAMAKLICPRGPGTSEQPSNNAQGLRLLLRIHGPGDENRRAVPPASRGL